VLYKMCPKENYSIVVEMLPIDNEKTAHIERTRLWCPCYKV